MHTKVKCHVRMSELHSQELVVGAWEVPILEVVHGTADVQVRGEVQVEGDLPIAAEEFQRLERRYGNDPENTGVPFVAQVYGHHGAGVRAMARAMEESQPAEQTVSLVRMRKEELQKIAGEEFGIEGVADMNREQLIEAIREAQDSAAA